MVASVRSQSLIRPKMSVHLHYIGTKTFASANQHNFVQLVKYILMKISNNNRNNIIISCETIPKKKHKYFVQTVSFHKNKSTSKINLLKLLLCDIWDNWYLRQIRHTYTYFASHQIMLSMLPTTLQQQLVTCMFDHTDTDWWLMFPFQDAPGPYTKNKEFQMFYFNII